MLISRYDFGGARPHLYGANIIDLTLSQLQSINGSLSIDFDGYTYSGSIDLSGQSFSGAASAIQTALNQNRPVAATTTGSSIAPVSVSFTGSVNGLLLQVTSVSSGSIELGAQISGPGIAAGAQIVNQWDGTPGGPGLYVLFAPGGTDFVGDYDRELRSAHCRLRDFRHGCSRSAGHRRRRGFAHGHRRQSERQRRRKHLACQQRPDGCAREHDNDGASPHRHTTILSSARPQIATITRFSQTETSASITIHRP